MRLKVRIKKTLSLFLTLIMLVGLVPQMALSVSASETANGETKTPSVTVFLSVSHDDDYYECEESSKIMALQKITIPYFDLAKYGLEQYYFNSEEYVSGGAGSGTAETAYGKVTAMHLHIWATEVFYCGLEPEEAGQGYLYDQGLLGTDTLKISGGTGSSFMNYFWGFDCNLNYYKNYEYPLASEGWGATADQILLEDGDIWTIGHFSDWAFYSDSASIFNYIKAGDDIGETTATVGEIVDMTVYRADGDLTIAGATEHTLVDSEPEVFYVAVDKLNSGDISSWTSIGNADASGNIKVDTTNLAPGEYLVCVKGQYGLENPEAIVSTPGGIILKVEAAQESEDPAVEEAKTAAKAELTSYKNADDYLDAEKEVLANTILAGEAKIDAAEYVEAVAAALAEAKAELDLIKTKEQLTSVIYQNGVDGSNFPYSRYYVDKLTMSGVELSYTSGTDVYLAHTTPKDAEVTFTVTAGGSSSGNLGINWNDDSTNTKEYTTSLVDGKATVKVYAYKASGAGISRNGTKVFNISIAEKNEVPVLAEGYLAETTASVTSGDSYTIDLNEVFTDADNDTLSYKVSVNGGSAVAADASYSYLNEIPGIYVLKFVATDGKTSAENQPTHTVTLTVKNSETTYDVGVTVQEELSPKFYAVNNVTSGAVVKGNELVYENNIVKVPENIKRIMWEAEGTVGFSVPVSENTNIELQKVTFDTKFDSGEADKNASVSITDSNGVKVSGTTADTYILPATSGFIYKVTTSNSAYNSVELKDQTPTTGCQDITFNLKRFTVTAPKGSVVSAGTLSGSFAYSFAKAISSKTVGETVVYEFAPLSGNAFVRVQRPDDKDAVTYWDWKSSKADGKTITITEEMLFMDDSEEDKFDDDTVYRNFEKYELDLGDIYMNINNQGYINLNVGDTKGLNMFRNWQAIESFINAKISLPDFSYEIINIEGENVISIDPNADNSAVATLTAQNEGTAIVLVTYDAMYSDSTAGNASGAAGGGNRLSAIWPDRTGVFVVSVGKDGTSIKSNMTCNGAVFDAEHSPQFYVGDAGATVSFKPDDGVDVTVNRSTVGKETLSFGEFTKENVSVAEDGTVTVSGLKTGRHIIKLEKDGVASYQVVTAQQATVQYFDEEGESLGDVPTVTPGSTVTIKIKGLTNPAEKFATKYNFNAQIGYKDQAGNGYANSSGTGYGKYNFSSQEQVIVVNVPADWTEDKLVLNGYVQMGGFSGDVIGGHRKVNYGVGSGMAWGSDAGMKLGTLPELSINVLSLDEMKESAKQELLAYKNPDDYRESEKTMLNMLLEDANRNIDEADKGKVINEIVASTKTAIDSLETDAQLTLKETKSAAKAELASYKDADDYRDAEKEVLANAILAGEAKIDAAESVEAVEKALTDAKDAIDKIKTDNQLTKEELEAIKVEAEAAKAAADAAKEAAETAKAEAEAAKEAAETAKAEADTAKTEAKAAKEAAETAKAAAETAKTEAKAEAEKAAEAKAAAEATRTEAEKAQAKAAADKAEAEAAKAEAKAAQTAAEAAKADAEAARKAAEAEKKATEEEKAKAEAAKAEAEAAKAAAQAAKAEAEAAKAAAASDKEAAEEARKAAEAAQKSAEESLKAAEDAQKAAEEALKEIQNALKEAEAKKALLDAQIAAKKEVASYKDAKDYLNAQKEELEQAVEEAYEAIDAAKTTEEVEQVLTAAKETMDAIKTAEELELPYVDVMEEDWFYEAVAYAYHEGVMTGKEESVFAPDEDLLRGQFASILHRMEGEPEVAFTPEFPDVTEDAWYAEAVLWAKDAEIVNGYQEGGFGPSDDIVREQMAVMMYNYASYKGYDVSAADELAAFDDAGEVSDYALEAVRWAVGSGIISGKDGIRLAPQDATSRAECAAIIMNFMEQYSE